MLHRHESRNLDTALDTATWGVARGRFAARRERIHGRQGGGGICQRLHFHVKIYPTFLAAGHCPDLLGELTLQSPSSNCSWLPVKGTLLQTPWPQLGKPCLLDPGRRRNEVRLRFNGVQDGDREHLFKTVIAGYFSFISKYTKTFGCWAPLGTAEELQRPHSPHCRSERGYFAVRYGKSSLV